MEKTIIINKKTLNKLKSLNREKKLKEELKKKRLKELLIIIPALIVSQNTKVIQKDTKKRTVKLEEKEIKEVKKEVPTTKDQLSKEAPSKQDIQEPKEVKEDTKEKLKDVLITTGLAIPKVISSTKEKPSKEHPVKEEQKVKKEESIIEEESKEETTNKELEKYKSSKIVEAYSKKLKDIRYEIRQIDYKYKVIEDSYENTYKEKDIKVLLDNLNILIKKIDELKKKLEIPNKYDDKYIYDLVEEYIKEFNNNKAVKEIKESPLYIEISQKIKELSSTKNKLKEDVSNRSKEIKKSNSKLASSRSKYETLKQKSNDITQFEKDAYKELNNLNRLVANAVSIKEKVQVRVRKSHNLSKLILAAIASDLALNNNQSARSMAIKVAVGAFLIRHIMSDRYAMREEIKYEIKDYRSKIEKEISSLDGINKSLDKSSKEIKELIKDLNYNYRDYINNNSEFYSLIINLEIIDSNIDEKRYMINNIKSKEERLLREHSSKIKTINN